MTCGKLCSQTSLTVGPENQDKSIFPNLLAQEAKEEAKSIMILFGRVLRS